MIFCMDGAAALREGANSAPEIGRGAPDAEIIILHDMASGPLPEYSGVTVIPYTAGNSGFAIVNFLSGGSPNSVVHVLEAWSQAALGDVRRLDEALEDAAFQAAYIRSNGELGTHSFDRIDLVRDIVRGHEVVVRSRFAIRLSALLALDGVPDLFEARSVGALLIRLLVGSSLKVLRDGDEGDAARLPFQADYRLPVFEELRTPACLAIVDRVFPPLGVHAGVPEELRLWYLGQRLVRLDDPDARMVGSACLKDALRDNALVAATVAAVLGGSPRQEVESINLMAGGSEFRRTSQGAASVGAGALGVKAGTLDLLARGSLEFEALEMELGLARRAVDDAHARNLTMELEIARLNKELRIESERVGGALKQSDGDSIAEFSIWRATASGIPVEPAPPFTPTGSRIAVVICCYSGEPYFLEAAESVRAQTHRGIDLIFHDNGCADSYRDLIKQTAARLRARVIRTEVNRYGEGLRYDVLPHLNSEYVAILHDDDYYAPGKISSGLNYIDKNGLDYLFTDRLYVNAGGVPFPADYEEVNTSPIESSHFPYRLNADTYFSGLRLHFSTLIMKTRFARHNLMGDPFLPRITDSLFMQRLLLNRDLKGAVLPEKQTYVRVHGANDMLYDKFGPEQRSKEFALLNIGEYYCFQELLQMADDDQLRQTFRIFPRIELDDDEDRVSMLVKAALDLRNWRLGKQLMGAYCVHQSFLIDPIRTMDLVRTLSGKLGGGPETDANRLTKGMYQTFITQFADLLKGQSDDGHRLALEAVYNSTSWKVTEPLRRAVTAVRHGTKRLRETRSEA